MQHGAVEVFAYQETLLIMALFGLAILVMIWAGFRRWLQSREKTGRLQMERVEARLNAIEQLVTDGGAQITAPVDELRSNPLSDPSLKRDES